MTKCLLLCWVAKGGLVTCSTCIYWSLYHCVWILSACRLHHLHKDGTPTTMGSFTSRRASYYNPIRYNERSNLVWCPMVTLSKIFVVHWERDGGLSYYFPTIALLKYGTIQKGKSLHRYSFARTQQIKVATKQYSFDFIATNFKPQSLNMKLPSLRQTCKIIYCFGCLVSVLVGLAMSSPLVKKANNLWKSIDSKVRHHFCNTKVFISRSYVSRAFNRTIFLDRIGMVMHWSMPTFCNT